MPFARFREAESITRLPSVAVKIPFQLASSTKSEIRTLPPLTVLVHILALLVAVVLIRESEEREYLVELPLKEATAKESL